MTTQPIEYPIPGYTGHADQDVRLIDRVRRRFPDRPGLQIVDVRWPQDEGEVPVVVLDDLGRGPAKRREDNVSPALWADERAPFKVAAALRERGRVLVRWDRRTHQAWSITDGTYTADRHIMAAKYLGVQTWELSLAVSCESMRVDRVTVTHSDEVKLGGGIIALTPVFHAYDGGSWVHAYSSNSRRGTLTWKSGADPLADVLLDTFEPDSTDAIPPLWFGRSESGEDIWLDLATDATHIALQGQARSGKSVLTYSLLTRLAASRSVRIVGVDPSGVTLGPFRGTRHDPYLSLGTADPARTVRVLQDAVAEMDRRTAALYDERTDKIEHFTPERPLIVVVLEEFPGARRALEVADAAEGAKPAEKRLVAFDLAVSRLLAEGPKVGIRVVVIAQRMEAVTLKGGDRANVSTRISMRVDKAEAVGMLHESLPEGYDVEAVRNFPQGIGLFESSVAGIPVTRFRAPYREGGYRVFFDLVRSVCPATDDHSAEEVDLGTVDLDWDEDAFTVPAEPESDDDLADLDLDLELEPAAHHDMPDLPDYPNAPEEAQTW